MLYIKRTNVMQLGNMFICNCNIALHISDAICVHLQEHLQTVVAASGEWHEASTLSVDAIDLGRLVGYLTLPHVTHQRLLLQSVSAPEDGRK